MWWDEIADARAVIGSRLNAAALVSLMPLKTRRRVCVHHARWIWMPYRWPRECFAVSGDLEVSLDKTREAEAELSRPMRLTVWCRRNGD